MTNFFHGKKGFSLVEINVALLVVGIGLVSLMGLFPVGLRQADQANADSVQATFAEQVLSIIEANALENRDELFNAKNDAQIRDILTQSADAAGTFGSRFKVGTLATLSNYLGINGSTIRYILRVDPLKGDANGFSDGRLWRASIRVSDRARGDIAGNPIYSTDIYVGTAD